MDQRPHPSGTAAGQGSIQHTSRIKLFWHWLFVISVISKKNVCEHWLQLCSHFGWLHSVPCLPLLFPVCFLSQLSCMAIRCDVWQQPMDFIFTTPPSTAMTCYDYCIYNHIVYMYFVVPHALQLTSIKPSLAVPYPYHPQDGSDLWPRDNALQRFGALLPSRGPRTHSHRAGAAGGVRALRSRPGVGGLEGAWGGWF